MQVRSLLAADDLGELLDLARQLAGFQRLSIERRLQLLELSANSSTSRSRDDSEDPDEPLADASPAAAAPAADRPPSATAIRLMIAARGTSAGSVILTSTQDVVPAIDHRPQIPPQMLLKPCSSCLSA